MTTSPPVRPTAEGPSAPPSVTRAARRFHAATIVAGTVVLAVLGRGQWFFGDEWDPIAQRSVFGDAQKGLLVPHNEHWSTIAVVVYRAHLAVFGLRTYVPLMVMFVAVCVLTAHLLWRFCCRTGCDPYVASVLALAFLLFGPAGAEVVFAWNFTFVGALGAGFAVLVLVADRGPTTARDRWATWGLGTLAVALSGVGLTMLVVVGACLLWSRGWRVALEALAVPGGVYAVWTLDWGRDRNSLTSTRGLRQVPDFAGSGLSFLFDDFTHIAFTGVAVLVALVVYALVARRTWTGTRAWALCSAGGAALFYALVAIRRDSPFLPGPRTGRYLWVAFALLVPLLGLAVTALVRRGRPVAVIVALTAGVLLVVQVTGLGDDAAAARDAKAAERRRVIAAARLADQGTPMVGHSVLSTSVFEDSATVGLLERLDRAGDLPRARIGAADLLGARAELQVAVDHWGPRTDDAPARITGLHQAVATPGADGCVVVAPNGPGAHVRLTPDPAATTAARMDATFPAGFAIAVDDHGTLGPWRSAFPFVPLPYRLRLAASESDVLVGTAGTVVTFCNVTVDPALYAG